MYYFRVKLNLILRNKNGMSPKRVTRPAETQILNQHNTCFIVRRRHGNAERRRPSVQPVRVHVIQLGLDKRKPGRKNFQIIAVFLELFIVRHNFFRGTDLHCTIKIPSNLSTKILQIAIFFRLLILRISLFSRQFST